MKMKMTMKTPNHAMHPQLKMLPGMHSADVGAHSWVVTTRRFLWHPHVPAAPCAAPAPYVQGGGSTPTAPPWPPP